MRVDVADLFRSYQRPVFAYLLRVTGDRSLAEDLAQEVFLRAFRNAARFRGDASLRTWLFVIARSVLASHYRRRRLPFADVAEADLSVNVDPAERLGVDGQNIVSRRRGVGLQPISGAEQGREVLRADLVDLESCSAFAARVTQRFLPDEWHFNAEDVAALEAGDDIDVLRLEVGRDIPWRWHC